MAVTFDALGPSSAGATQTGSTVPFTWSHTCSGTNRLLVVGIVIGCVSDAGMSATATYNSVSMTSITTRHTNDSTAGYAQMFYLIAPSTGANTVSINVTGGTGLEGFSCGSVSFTGVDQTTPIPNFTSAAGNTASCTASLTGASGNMLIDLSAAGNTLAATNQTAQWLANRNTSTGAGNGGMGTATGAGSSVTFTRSITAADFWAEIIAEVAASSSATTGFVSPSPPPGLVPTAFGIGYPNFSDPLSKFGTATTALVAISDSDTSTGTEAVNTKAFLDADTSTGTDAPSVKAFSDADTSSGTEAVTTKAFSGTETSSAADTAPPGVFGRTATVVEQTSATSVTATLPTDRVTGDLVVVVFAMTSTVGQFTGPGGSWTQFVAPTDNGVGEIIAAYYQFNPGSAPTGTTSGAASRQTALCQAYANVDATTPIDISAQITTATNTSIVATGVTTVTNNALLLSGCMTDTASRTFVIPSGMNTTITYSAGTTGRAACLVEEVRPASGATGTRTWSMNPSASLAMAAFTVALRPSAATTVSASETGTGTEAVTVKGFSDPDTATSTEAVTAKAFADAETSAAAEAPSAKAFADADTSSGADAPSVKAFSDADTSAGVDVLTTKAFGDADTSASVEAVTAKAFSNAETGTGTEAVTTKTFSDTETGTGNDNGSVGTATPISDSDTSTGTDATSTRAATVASAETSSGAEASSIVNTTSTTETSTGTDAVSTAVVSWTATETSTATDAAVSVVNAITAADTASGTEAVTTKAFSTAEVSASNEASSLNTGGPTPVTDTETSTGTEATSTSVTLSAAETSSGADAISSLSGGSMPSFVTYDYTGTTGNNWSTAAFNGSGINTTAANTTLQSNVGRMDTGSQSSYNGKCSRFINYTDQANAEIYIEFKYTAAESFFDVMLRSDNSGDGSDGYQFLAARGGTVKIYKVQSFNSTNLGSYSFTIADNTWYSIRFQVIGTNQKAKIWATAGSEPGSWNISASDSAITAAGGALLTARGGGSGGATIDVDNLVFSDGSVITNITAIETVTGTETVTGSLVSKSSSDTSGTTADVSGGQGRSDNENSLATDLGAIAGTPIFATDTGGSSDAVTVYNAVISGYEFMTSSETQLLTVPPIPIVDYEFIHYQDLARRVGRGPYRFTLPYTEGPRAQHRFFRRISDHRGLTLLRIGGLFQLLEEPTYEDFQSADRIYIGGYSYLITDDEAQELGDAGYDAYIENFIYIPEAFYGTGQYGVSVYGN